MLVLLAGCFCKRKVDRINMLKRKAKQGFISVFKPEKTS